MANLGVALVILILVLFGGIGFYEYREAEKAKELPFHIPEMPEIPEFPAGAEPKEKIFELPEISEILELLREIWDKYTIPIALISMLVVGGIFALKTQWEFGLVSILLLTLVYSIMGVFWWWFPLVIGLVVAAVLVKEATSNG